jgi:hypothetical protein
MDDGANDGVQAAAIAAAGQDSNRFSRHEGYLQVSDAYTLLLNVYPHGLPRFARGTRKRHACREVP